jgi:hypothetical protein
MKLLIVGILVLGLTIPQAFSKYYKCPKYHTLDVSSDGKKARCKDDRKKLYKCKTSSNKCKAGFNRRKNDGGSSNRDVCYRRGTNSESQTTCYDPSRIWIDLRKGKDACCRKTADFGDKPVNK